MKTGKDYTQLLDALARLFFVTFAIFLPLWFRMKKAKKQIGGFHQKILSAPETGLHFIVGYSSEEYFKRYDKGFVLEGIGRLYLERDAVLFRGDTMDGAPLEMRFFSKVAHIAWIGKKWRSGIPSWFEIEQNGEKYFFTSDAILKGLKAFGTYRKTARRIYEEISKKLGETPLL